MPRTDDRLDLVPRQETGELRAFSMAVVVHLLLAAALTWGVSWTSSDPTISFEAELWSNVRQEAAPALEARRHRRLHLPHLSQNPCQRQPRRPRHRPKPRLCLTLTLR